MDGKSSTSLREQVFFYYVQKFYSDAENRYKHPTVGEFDIYVSSANLAIEYDGVYWHKSRLIRDNEKMLVRLRLALDLFAFVNTN